jgi:eukaryotic-like serine/threonine-protein kinase
MQNGPYDADLPRYRYRFGAVDFDASRFELLVAGRAAEVEHKPLQVLQALLAHVDEVVTKDELIESVWAGRLTGDTLITNAITKLRKALGEVDGARIVTVPRFGYRLAGPVERIAVGRKLASRLQLSAEQPVPGREHFVLDSQLGQSLGSEVWLARHAKTHQARVYKFGADGERLASLKREATVHRVLLQSLGERSDIARVIDWNFADEPFWLECEYGGLNLLDWAGHEQTLSRLTERQRIELFLQMADAVASAHSVGVLHKDLKPGNVLVAAHEGGWQVRIADFGSARLLEPGRLSELGITQLGLTLTQSDPSSNSGTPLYLAPELIAGQAPTVQSDLYALGLILYQLLQGDLKQPMASGWEHNVGDELLREDIAAATDGNPARRLGSVAELADRLRQREQRRLDRQQLQQAEQRAQAALQQLERTRARRPWFIAAGASLALGLAISLWLYRQADHARQLAEREAARAEAINRFLNDDLLGAADPGAPGSVSETKVTDVLARAATRVETRFAQEPDTRAAIEATLGRTYFALSDYVQAEAHRRRAVELLERTRGAGDDATLEAQYRLAWSLSQNGKLDDAVQRLDAADGAAGARLQQVSMLAYLSHRTRAAYHDMRQQNDAALKSYQQAQRVRLALDPANDRMLIETQVGLARCHLRLGQHAEAEANLRELIAPQYTVERLGRLGWIFVHLTHGITLNHLGRSTEAENTLLQVVDTARAQLGADHYYTGVALSQLADLYAMRGEFDRALAPAREAFDIVRKRSGERGQATLLARANLGVIEFESGQLQAAIGTLSEARAGLAALLGDKSPQAQGPNFYLAFALSNSGRHEEALALAERIDPAALVSVTIGGVDWAPRLQALKGRILVGQGREAEGLALLEPAIEQMKAGGMQSYIVAPFEQTLTQARSRSALATAAR